MFRTFGNHNFVARTVITIIAYKINSYFVEHFEKNTFKDTHKEKALSNKLNKTPMLLKSMNMDIWEVGLSHQLFIRGFLNFLYNFLN